MKIPPIPRPVMAIALVAFVVYLSGYAFFRYNKQIVHESSHTYDDGGRPVYSSHEIYGGDAQLVGSAINGMIATAYAPVCQLEKLAWHCARPVGSPLTAQDSEELKRNESSVY